MIRFQDSISIFVEDMKDICKGFESSSLNARFPKEVESGSSVSSRRENACRLYIERKAYKLSKNILNRKNE